MPYRKTQLGLLIQFDEEKAKKKILSAFKSNDLVTGKAAEALDVSVSGLKGYVVKLGLTDEIDELRQNSKKKNFPSYDREEASKLQTKLAKTRAAEAAAEEAKTSKKTSKKVAKKKARSKKSKKSTAAA